MISKKKSASRIPGRFLWGLLETGETAKSFKKGSQLKHRSGILWNHEAKPLLDLIPEPRCHDARDQPCIGLCLSWLPKDGGWWKPSRTVHAIFWTRIILEDSTSLGDDATNQIWYRSQTGFIPSCSRSRSAHMFKLWRMSHSKHVRFLQLNSRENTKLELFIFNHIHIIYIYLSDFNEIATLYPTGGFFLTFIYSKLKLPKFCIQTQVSNGSHGEQIQRMFPSPFSHQKMSRKLSGCHPLAAPWLSTSLSVTLKSSKWRLEIQWTMYRP